MGATYFPRICSYKWPVSMATVIVMILRPSPSNWLVRLLSIEDQVSLAVDQDCSVIHNRLASRENFLAMANLNEVSCILKSIEENSGRSASALASSSVLQFPGMSQCPGTQISETLNRPEGRLRQRWHSLMILELFATIYRDFIAAWLSENMEIRMKWIPFAKIHCAAR